MTLVPSTMERTWRATAAMTEPACITVAPSSSSGRQQRQVFASNHKRGLGAKVGKLLPSSSELVTSIRIVCGKGRAACFTLGHLPRACVIMKYAEIKSELKATLLSGR